jgi:RND family efflux transporter MFP subunit
MPNLPFLRLAGPILALTAAIPLMSGCGGSHAQPPPPVPSVTVAPVQQRDIVEWEEFTGRTEPVQSVEVRPRVSGYIQEVRIQSGQLVKKGDVLFIIDPRWHQAEFDRRQAEAERVRVQVENARREADRSGHLLATKAISTEDAEARNSRFQEAKAALLAAEASRDSAKLDLEYTQVRAPIDGRVSRALLTEGNYVSGTAGAATRLTTIVSVNPVYVHADMNEDSLLRFNALASQQKLETNSDGKVPVELQLGDEREFPHHGYLESLDNQLDPNTGSILLRAIFPNDDGRIVPGLFARIRVPLSARYPAVLVAERAIGTDQALKYVLMLTPTNTVAYRQVELGPVIDGLRVVRAGLQAGDQVVVNGIQRVRPGMPVKAESAVAGSDGPRMATR